MPTVIYTGYRPGLPDIVAGRWPPETGRTGYKTWICETVAELAEVRRRLDMPCPITGGALDFRRGPDAALSTPARGIEPADRITAALYPPPDPSWPWLVLLCIPAVDPGIERGRYAWEAFDEQDQALSHLTKLAAMTGEKSHHILPPATRQ